MGRALGENNYFVSDTNYGWGPNSIGDRTDIGHWFTWFADTETQGNGVARRDNIMEDVYAESSSS